MINFNSAVKLLGENIRIFARDDNGDIEVRDYWDFLTKYKIKGNNSIIKIDGDLLRVGNDWQNSITKLFIDRFGESQEYFVSW